MVSVFTGQLSEDRGQKTACKKLEKKALNLNSVLCSLFTDTRHLKPKITSCFVNYLQDTSLVRYRGYLLRAGLRPGSKYVKFNDYPLMLKT